MGKTWTCLAASASRGVCAATSSCTPSAGSAARLRRCTVSAQRHHVADGFDCCCRRRLGLRGLAGAAGARLLDWTAGLFNRRCLRLYDSKIQFSSSCGADGTTLHSWVQSTCMHSIESVCWRPHRAARARAGGRTRTRLCCREHRRLGCLAVVMRALAALLDGFAPGTQAHRHTRTQLLFECIA